MHRRALFDAIVSASGVSGVLAPGIVRRALLDRKALPEDAEPADYRAALPQLSARIAAYLPKDQAAQAVQRIEALLDQAEAEDRALDEDDDEDISIFARITEELRAATSQHDGTLRQSGERLRDGAHVPPQKKSDRSRD